jgi:phosphodiesterase/alkaline phosphatase D-like protein
MRAAVGAVAARSALGADQAAAAMPASFVRDFSRSADQAGWGAAWHRIHYQAGFRIARGRAVLALGGGSSTTAPSQPVPVFVLDRDSTNTIQEMDFSITNGSGRPGVLLRGKNTHSFLGVTVEEDRLVVAEYFRNHRSDLAQAVVPRLVPGVRYKLKVAAIDDTVRAKIWRLGVREPQWQLVTSGIRASAGRSGVLLVHPLDLERCVLRLARYELSAPDFTTTLPVISWALTGLPHDASGSEHSVRAAFGHPAEGAFEWTSDPTFSSGVETTGFSEVGTQPPTLRATIPTTPGQPTYWRVRARSLTSGAEAVGPVAAIDPYIPSDRLILGVASCAHLWDTGKFTVFDRFQEEASVRPAALMFQGDLGYAGNIRRSCYIYRPDFFFERFTRTLADPCFTRVQRRMPVGFIQDDHEYGVKNNPVASNVRPWAVDLYNNVHANPNGLGYFDSRFGDVHCFMIDCRRYSDSPTIPEDPSKTRLGATQLEWLLSSIQESTASLLLISSAGIFATRRLSTDCWVYGWNLEYQKLISAFMDEQIAGRRVLIMSGDAHGMRVHYHPDPAQREGAAGLTVAEFICSGVKAISWSPASPDDPTRDPARQVMDHSGMGMIDIDPPATPVRNVTLRALAANRAEPPDLFPPLVLPFAPEPQVVVPTSLPTVPRTLGLPPLE